MKAILPRDDDTSIPADALVQFLVGALFGLLMWWLEEKMRLSVKEVNQLFRHLAIPAVKIAQRQA